MEPSQDNCYGEKKNTRYLKKKSVSNQEEKLKVYFAMNKRVESCKNTKDIECNNGCIDELYQSVCIFGIVKERSNDVSWSIHIDIIKRASGTNALCRLEMLY